MKKKLNLYVLTTLLFMININYCIAQDPASKEILNTRKYKESAFRIGVNYSNDYVYAGRKDSIASPYITPYLSYFHKSGFFTRASISYLTAKSEARIDLSSLMLGYSFNGEYLFGGVNTNIFFFNAKSYAVQSEINASANGYLGYGISGFDLSVDISTLIGKELDIMTGVELSKSIYADKDRVQISPTIYTIAGTQHYYNEYYVIRGSNSVSRSGRKGRGGSITQPVTQTTVMINESSAFKLLAVDLSMPIHYTINKVRLSFLPAYAIPINPSSITIDQTTKTEDIKNVFYFTVGISIKI
ncbi:MAG: hypothetical protein ACK5AO_03945 [bacterium]